MRKFYEMSFALLIVWALVGCYDDKGDYDYNWVISAAVSNFEDSYTYRTGDTLVLKPDIRFMKQEGMKGEVASDDIFSEDEYAYYWIAQHYNRDKGVIISDTIGRERNLNYIVDLTPQDYTVIYQICNLTAGIKWLSHFDLSVTVSAPEGWLLLEDKEGMAELSIYARMGDSTMRMVRNVLANSGIPASSLTGPRQVFATYQTQVGNGVWILTDRFTGYLNVKAGHQWSARQIVQNHMVETPGSDFVFTKMIGLMYHTVFGFSDDGLRVARYPGMLYTGDLLPVGEHRFEVAPYLATMGNEMQTKQVLGFDKTHQCFKLLDISGNYNWTEADQKFPVGYDLMNMSLVGESGAQKIRCLLTKDESVYELVASSATAVEQGARRISSSEKFLNAEQCVYHHFLQFPYYLYQGKLYVNRAVDDDKEVEYYIVSQAEDEPKAVGQLVKTELEGSIVYINTVFFSDLNMTQYGHRRSFMNYLLVTTELPDGTGRVYFLTPAQANAHRLTITDMVETEHKVISIDYQRPGI